MGKIEHVSDTALWVAVHRGNEGLRQDPLFKDPLAFKLAGERGTAIAKNMAYGPFMSWLMSLRTIVIDSLITEAIQSGVTKVVNLGAGLDTRPYRMTFPKGVTWVEADFPHMIDHKNKILANDQPNLPLEREAVDLNNRNQAQTFFKSLSTYDGQILVITEGVIPYLSDEEASDLALDLINTKNIRFWIQDFRDGGFNANGLRWWFKVRMRRAPFKFNVADWVSFFAQRGWQVKHKIHLVDEGQRRGRPLPVAGWASFLSLLIPEEKFKAMNHAPGCTMLERRS